MNLSYTPSLSRQSSGDSLAQARAMSRRIVLVCCAIIVCAASAGAQPAAERNAPPAAPIPALARPGSWKISPMDAAPYSPLGLKEKFYLFNYRTIEPSGFAKSAFAAGIAQLTD